MKVTQEKLPASQIGLEIEIPPEKSKQAYEQVIQKFTRQANIPGFRKGKVPRQVVLQRFGTTQLKAAALEDLIENSLQEALKQENIDALGNFQLRSSFEDLISQYEPGSALTFSAAVDVQPDVNLKQYTGFTVQAEEIKPDPDRVNTVIEGYRQEVATVVPVEGRAAQLGDIAVVDFKGILPSEEPDAEPEEVPGGSAQDFQIDLEEGKFIEGFVTGIVGMNVGDTKDVTAKFPEQYPQPDVAGRDAVFTVTLKELKEKELPELDDDFAQEVSEFETLAALRESLEERFNKEAEEKTTENKEQALLDELLQHIEVDLPETLIEREVNFMLNQTAMQLQNQGIDVKRLFNEDTIPMMKERSRPDAINRIKRTLALGEIAKREAIEPPAEEINTKIAELLEQFGDEGIDHDRLKSVVTEDVLKEKIMAWLIEHSTVELVPEGSLKQDEPDVDDVEAGEAEPDAVAADVAVDAPSTDVTLDAEAVEVVEPEADVEPAAASSEPAPEAKSTKKSKKPTKTDSESSVNS